MKQIFFSLIFFAAVNILKAQDISELQKDNGYYNLHFNSPKADFRGIQPAENANPDWYLFKSSPKHKSFFKWDIEGEYGRFASDSLKDICINLLSSQDDASCKELVQKCEEKYGKIYKTIETPQSVIYQWEAPNATFSVILINDTKEPGKFVVRAVYSAV